MTTEVIKLHFNTPLHIGSGKEELDKSSLVYHSDALKSAIYALGIPFYPEWENESTFFDGFRISSCFPYYRDELFLPKPFGLMQLDFDNNEDDVQRDKVRKKSKKVVYLSADVFRRWSDNPQQPVSIDENTISFDGTFIFSDKENVATIYKSEVQQRVKVNVENEESSRPFYIDRLYFTPEAGLYFIIQFENEKIKKQVLQSLHLLGDFGIGTDRTVGNGLFSFDEKDDIKSYELPDKNILNKRINLGLYLPKKEEIRQINLNNSSWQLIKRGGYMAGSSEDDFKHLRKNNIYFFSEGSVFNTENKLNGKYVDLRPDWNEGKLHPVWRDGQPVFINL